MRQTCDQCHVNEHNPRSCKKCSPRGVTVLYLKTSKMIALIYGSLSRSSNVGSLSLSVTQSMSSCARCMTSGWSEIRAKKERKVQLVFVAGEVNLTGRRKNGSLTESVAAAYITAAQSMMSSSFCLASSGEREASEAISSREVETKQGTAVPSSFQN